MKSAFRFISTAPNSRTLSEKPSKDSRKSKTSAFDDLTSSPKSQIFSRFKETYKKSKWIKVSIQTLKFRSKHRPKKVYKFKLYPETLELEMEKELEERLAETPDDDFDCESDDEMIDEAIRKKQRELAGMLIRPLNLC